MLLLAPSTDVTLELMPMPLAAAFERFNAVTGEKWEPSGVLRNTIVVVRLDHAPYAEVRTRLAQAFDAKWQGSQLVVNEELLRARKAANRKSSAEKVAASLAYVAKRLAGQPDELTAKDVAATKRRKEGEETLRKDAEARQDWSGVFKASRAAEEDPAWRALARIAPSLTYGEKPTVFSDRPTPMQTGLPITLKPIFDKYRREAKLAGKDPAFARVRIKVEPWSEAGGATISMVTLGSDGKTLDSVSIRMNGDNELMNKGGYGEPTIPPGVELPMSEDALSYFALVNSDYKDTSKRDKGRLRQEWAERFTRPTEFEPLVWQRGEAYVRTATATNKQLVGRMSDFQNLRYDRNSKWTAPRFLPPIDGSVNLDGDWMTLRGYGGQDAIDRVSAGRLIAESIRQGGVPLEAAATFAAGVPDKTDPFLNWVGDELIALFGGHGGYSALSTTINENGLRLWGHLTPPQKQALKSGKSLRISGLPMGTREEIRRAVFEIGALDGEPTDLLPNGLEDGDVTVKITEQPLLIVWEGSKGFPDEPMPMPPESLGKALSIGIPYWEITPDQARTWNRYRLGTFRSYNLTIRFDRGPSYNDGLSETLFPPSGKDLTELPPSITEAVNKARAAAKATPKKAGGGSAP